MNWEPFRLEMVIRGERLGPLALVQITPLHWDIVNIKTADSLLHFVPPITILGDKTTAKERMRAVAKLAMAAWVEKIPDFEARLQSDPSGKDCSFITYAQSVAYMAINKGMGAA